MDDMSYEIAEEYGMKMKKKKGHGFLIFFISLIIGIIIGGAGVGYYLVEIDNPFEKKDKVVKKDKEEVKTTDLDTESYLVENLINRFHTNTAQNEEMLLYASDELNAEDLDSNYINYLIVNEAKRQMLGQDEKLTIENMKKALNTLFGETSSFVVPEENFGDCPKYTYDEEEKVFTESTEECKINEDKTLERTITKATIKDKKIEIYEAVAFFDNKEKKVYKKIDANGEFTEELKNFDTSNFLIKRDKNKVNTYKYTFIYDEDTANYIFESLSLEK